MWNAPQHTSLLSLIYTGYEAGVGCSCWKLMVRTHAANESWTHRSPLVTAIHQRNPAIQPSVSDVPDTGSGDLIHSETTFLPRTSDMIHGLGTAQWARENFWKLRTEKNVPVNVQSVKEVRFEFLFLLFFRLIGKLFHLKHAVCFKGSLSIKSSIAFINFIHFLPEVWAMS